MRSYPHPLTLGPGEFPLLENVRFDTGVIECRPGISEISTTGLPTGSDIFRGATLWNGKLYSAFRAAARANSWGAIDLYESSDAATWTKITSDSAGQQGTDSTGDSAVSGNDNRLNDNGFASFVPITAPVYNFNQTTRKQNVNVLAVSTGDHATAGRGCQPRILNGSQSSLIPPAVAIHRTVDYPKVSGLTSRVGLPRYFIINAMSAGSSLPNLGVSVPFVSSGGLSAPLMTMFGGTTTQDGDRVGFIGASNDVTLLTNWDKRQFITVVKTKQPEVLQSFAFSVTDGASEYTVYDPQDPTTTLSLEPFGDPDSELYLTLYTGTTDDVVNADYDGFNMTWRGADASPTDDIYLSFLTVAWGGTWPGLGQFSISYLNSSSLAESPAAVLDIGPGMKISEIGGSAYFSDEIPQRTYMFVEPKVPVPSPSTAERDRGVDTALLYRREDGENKYYLLNGTQGDVKVAEYSGGWAWVSPYTAELQNQFVSLTANEGRSGAMTSPTPFCKAIQPFSCGDVASGRGVFGSGSRIQISESNNPFRHQEIVNSDEFGNLETWSASEQRFDGETCKQIDSVASSIYGAQQAVVWTDKGMYSVDTSDPTLGASFVSSGGIAAPQSLASKDGHMAFLDTDRQIRFVASGRIESPSERQIDDFLQSPKLSSSGQLRGIPTGSLPKAAGAWFNSRYYLGITPAGESRNSKVLIYDARQGAWMIDSPAPVFSVEQWIAFPDASVGRDRLLAFGHDGKIFDYENPSVVGDLDSDTISVAVETPEYSSRHEAVSMKRVGIAFDVLDGREATIDRTFRSGVVGAPGGDTMSSSTISLGPDTSTPGWNWTTIGEAGRGASARLRFEADVVAGWKLLWMVAELEAPGGRGASVGVVD